MQTGRENFFDRVFRPAEPPHIIIFNRVKNFVTLLPHACRRTRKKTMSLDVKEFTIQRSKRDVKL